VLLSASTVRFEIRVSLRNFFVRPPGQCRVSSRREL
jgi:hypothetical protein